MMELAIILVIEGVTLGILCWRLERSGKGISKAWGD